MRAVILQPGYLPWLGAFDQLTQADVYVFLDDVVFQRGGVGRDSGWDNRNQIKTTNGTAWLTVPCEKTHGPTKPLLKDVQIASGDDWFLRHSRTIQEAYKEAPFVGDALMLLERSTGSKLVDLNIHLFRRIAEYLGLVGHHEPEYVRSSLLGISSDKRGTERVLNICNAVGADEHLNGPAALSYVKPELYEEAGVELVIHDYLHPVYQQQHGEFVSHMSIIDLIANEGPRSLGILVGRG